MDPTDKSRETCRTCGALMGARRTHDEWHEKTLGEQMRKVAEEVHKQAEQTRKVAERASRRTAR